MEGQTSTIKVNCQLFSTVVLSRSCTPLMWLVAYSGSSPVFQFNDRGSLSQSYGFPGDQDTHLTHRLHMICDDTAVLTTFGWGLLGPISSRIPTVVVVYLVCAREVGVQN